MKKSLCTLVLILMFGLGLAACARGGLVLGQNQVRGSGKVVKETRSVSGFHGVNLATLGDLEIELGESEGLRIEAEENLLPYLETNVENGILVIRGRERAYLQPTEPVKYTLTVTSLDSIEASSLGSITAPSLEAEELTVAVSSAGSVRLEGLQAGQVDLRLSSLGNLNIDRLEADQLEASISGSGSLEIGSGEVQGQDITLSSLGSYRSKNVNTPDQVADAALNIQASGSGNAELGRLNADHADIRLTSLGGVSIESLNASTLSVNIGGSGKAELHGGEVEEQTVTLTSMGSYLAGDLQSARAEVEISGSGSAEIRVSEHLKANLSSMGSLRYTGSPEVEQTSSGSGRVEQVAP